jgi:TonB family protein
VFCWIAACGWLCASTARAEPPPPPPEPETAPPDVLVAPAPLETPIEYPEGQTGSAQVVLELTLDASGQVRSAQVIDGDPMFAAAALHAVERWRFSPATRGGKNVPARIRYTIRFEPPLPETPKLAPVTPAAPRPALTPSAPVAPVPFETLPIDIVVEGERAAPGSVTVTREEARELPGSFGDPLRAIEAQPGVVPIVSGLPAFFIRGAPPANVGFFVDGVDIPVLYHAFFGPSVLHPELIAGVEFYPGAAPVQFGRFAGPVVAVKRRPFLGRRTGQATVRAIDAGVLVESPFASDCNGRDACSRSGAPVGVERCQAQLLGLSGGGQSGARRRRHRERARVRRL